MPRTSNRRLIRQRAALALFAVIATPLSARAGGVRIVEPTGTSNYPDIQSAVDAAVNGDVLLVGAGSYPGFTIAYKSLTVAAALNGAVLVDGAVRIQGLPAGKDLALIGFKVIGPNNGPALWVSNCAGNVLLQDCSFRGDYGPLNGVDVTSSSSVALVRSTASGAPGYADGVYSAGDGLRCSNSSLAVYDSFLIGGDATAVCDEQPGDGGWGYRGEPGSVLFASGTLAEGGKGGDDCACFESPGKGGAGFSVAIGAALHLFDIAASAGPPGMDPCGASAGSFPAIFNQGGTVTNYPGTARKLAATPALYSDVSFWSFSIAGANGDRMFLPGGRALAFDLSPSHSGVWLIGLPTGPTPPLGVVPGSGVLAAQKLVADVPLPMTHRTIFSQVMAVDSMGERILGAPAARIALNREAGPDCNGNGVQDYIDVIKGFVPDVNHNLIPDNCPGG